MMKKIGGLKIGRNTIKHVDLNLNNLKLEFLDGTSEELDVYYVYLSYEEINRFRKDFNIAAP